MWLPTSLSYNANSDLFIVIHKTGGDATVQSTYNTLLNRGLSVNYTVGQDGFVGQFVKENRGAWGNCCLESGHNPILPSGDPNRYTISIEHCDPRGDNSSPLTPAQKTASFKLVADICRRHGIRADHIVGHNEIEPISKPSCPGNYPMAELKAFIASGGSMLPTGWTDDGTTLTAKNGIKVVRGFRNKVLAAASWDSDNVPNEEGHQVSQVLLHRPDLGNGEVQSFRDDFLWFTSARGVVQEKELGLEMFLREKIIADQTQEIADRDTELY